MVWNFIVIDNFWILFFFKTKTKHTQKKTKSKTKNYGFQSLKTLSGTKYWINRVLIVGIYPLLLQKENIPTATVLPSQNNKQI